MIIFKERLVLLCESNLSKFTNLIRLIFKEMSLVNYAAYIQKGSLDSHYRTLLEKWKYSQYIPKKSYNYQINSIKGQLINIKNRN